MIFKQLPHFKQLFSRNHFCIYVLLYLIFKQQTHFKQLFSGDGGGCLQWGYTVYIINVASFGSHTVASSVLSTIFCGIFWQVHFSVIELRLRLHRRKWVIQLQHNYIEKTCNQLRLPITCNCNWVIVIQLRLLPMSAGYTYLHVSSSSTLPKHPIFANFVSF